MKTFGPALTALALAALTVGFVPSAFAADKMMSASDQKMMSSCMAMSHDAMMADKGCMSMMKKMKMSDGDMQKMMACKGMSHDAMMADKDCMSMSKMHPGMMTSK